jgi:hypothetical protein
MRRRMLMMMRIRMMWSYPGDASVVGAVESMLSEHEQARE